MPPSRLPGHDGRVRNVCAWFFGDSFDLYSTITDCGGYWDGTFGGTASLTLSASGRFTGSRGISPATIATVPYITKTSGANDSVHHITLAFQQTATLTGSALAFFCTLYDGATAQCTIIFRSDGALLLTSGIVTGTVLATYTGAVAATNTWYAFEIEVVINNTTGSISVRKNGNTSNDFSLGSLNTRNSTNNYANKLGIGADAGTAQIIDDLLWRSDASSVPFVGDIRCFTRMPASDASVAWSRSGTTVPVTPVQTAASNTNGLLNTAKYQSFTAPCSGTIGTMTLNCTAAMTGNIKAAIYASSGSAPTTPLGTATPVNNPAIGTVTLTFASPPSVTQGTQYYAALIADNSTGTFAYSTTQPLGMSTLSSPVNTPTYATFPLTGPTGLSATPTVNYQFTVNISATTNSAFVADIQQDGANSYVYSSTVSQSDLYGIAAIGSTPSSIVGVTTRGYFQKSDAGTRNVAVQLQSGGTNTQGASTALNTAWGWISKTDLVDPNTGAAWTATGVNNAEIGALVTA